MSLPNEEMCQNCIWWIGDSSGMQGQCTNGNDDTRTGRYESCVSFLDRDIGFDNGVELDDLKVDIDDWENGNG
jgi:hypothetical protein